MDSLNLNFDYLDLINSISLRRRPVNVFQLSRYPHWETVTSNIWAYFLDPEERHNFGTLFLEAVFREIKRNGIINEKKLDEIIHGFKRVTVNREVLTRNVEKKSDRMKRIDIEVEGDFGGLVLENKIDASPNYNDLNIYREQAFLDSMSTESTDTDRLIYFGFLTQSAVPEKVNKKWNKFPNYFEIRYDNIFNQLVKLLVKYDYGNFDSRSWDIFLQFVENTSLIKNKEGLKMEIKDVVLGERTIRENAKKIEDSKHKVKKVNQAIQATVNDLVINMQRLDENGILGENWPTEWPTKDASGTDIFNFWVFRGTNTGIYFKDHTHGKFCVEFYYVRGGSEDTDGKIFYKAWKGNNQAKGAIQNRFEKPFKSLEELSKNIQESAKEGLRIIERIREEN